MSLRARVERYRERRRARLLRAGLKAAQRTHHRGAAGSHAGLQPHSDGGAVDAGFTS